MVKFSLYLYDVGGCFPVCYVKSCRSAGRTVVSLDLQQHAATTFFQSETNRDKYAEITGICLYKRSIHIRGCL